MPQTPEAPSPLGSVACTEQAYRSLLFSDKLSRCFPRFVTQLHQHHGEKANWGRACVLEFQRGKSTVIKEFCSPKQLRSHFYEPRDTSRRLWLLEDVSLNWITILGAHLRIPPSFFASHWADPSGADFNERHTFVINPRRRFLIKYPQFRRVTVHGVKGDLRSPLLAMKCNVERYFFCSGYEDTTYENPEFARTYHNLSFWGSELSCEDWDGADIAVSG